MLCAPFRTDDLASIWHANEVADLIELRLDLFKPFDIKKLRSDCQKPVIFTLKEPDWELLKLGPEYVDLPSSLPQALFEKVKARFPQMKVICSHHNFESSGDLNALAQKLKEIPADLYKIATHASSTLDALRMLLYMRENRCLGVSMGPYGEISRILAPVVGAPWTYAPLNQKNQTAPGQVLLSELKRLYHYSSLSSKTSLYGLIGDPVTHSKSHIYHNFAFQKLNLDAVYVKMEIKKEELPPAFEMIKKLGFKGLSVTMPLKEEVPKLLDSAENTAINTIVIGEKTAGYNTDGKGALDALEKKVSVKGKKVVLLGAGGAARAIALEAKLRGASLTILNRTLARAKALATLIEGKAGTLEEFAHVGHYDILINTTSVGMDGDPRLPIDATALLKERVVMEIITNPAETPLVKAAQEKNCLIVSGKQMWLQQAVGQYLLWFKHQMEPSLCG